MLFECCFVEEAMVFEVVIRSRVASGWCLMSIPLIFNSVLY